jgi:peptide/nickel transport system permease protein
MARYVARRLLWSIPVLIVASIIVFAVMRIAIDPTAALRLNPRIRPEDIQRIRVSLGLDKSGIGQYWAWLSHFIRGDWGLSVISQRSVSEQIRTALVNSAILGIIATVFSLIIGLAIGMYSALRQYSKFDSLATSGAFIGLSMPQFWFAIMLQLFFGVYLVKWLHLHSSPFGIAGMTSPGSTGFDLMDRARHLVLPALVLSMEIVAVYSRYMRASMLEVLHADYLRTARAKGIRERRVVFRHAVRNALIPVTTVVALNVGAIAAGLIITEQVFQWPGMGPLFITSINGGDYPLALAWVMVTVGAVIIFNLLADVVYALLDPRIRYA